MREQKGADSTTRNMPADSELLFVLRYRRNLRAGIIFMWTSLAIVLGVMVLVVPPKGAKELAANVPVVYGVLMLLFNAIDLTLSNDIRLYRDRIVKRWTLLGEREVRLANAKLIGYSRLGGGAKTFYNQESYPSFVLWRLLGTFFRGGVCYSETLADPKDVKELNRLLAELSGRKVEEFERPRISMPKLIKRDTNNV
jgi:hypothetical protein